MDGVMLPFLPAGLWLFAVALAILILLIFLGFFAYVKKKMTAMAEDAAVTAQLASKKDQAELLAKKQQLEADVAVLRDWIRDQKIELERITAEREQQERDRAELESIKEEISRREADLREMRKEAGELENNRHMVTKRVEELEERVRELKDVEEKVRINIQKLNKELGKVESDINTKQNELAELKDSLDEAKTILREADKAKIMHSELLAAKSVLEIKIEDLRKSSEKEFKIAEEAKMVRTRLDREVSELKGKRDSLEDQIAGFSNKLSFTRTEIEQAIKKKLGIEEQLKNLEEEKVRLIAEIDRSSSEYQKSIRELEEQNRELKETKEEVAIQERIEEEKANSVKRLTDEEIALNASIKVLEKKMQEKKGSDPDIKEKYSDLWHPISFPDLTPAEGSIIEKNALEKAANYIRGKKLQFHERTLNAFHTALKVSDISPIVVLAGISGTGKSELPRRYAEGMGLHFVILPVQPRWDSPQDLFGFYNYLEGRYKATELARAMVQFELYNRSLWPLPENWNHDRSDRMLLVLLDEMNLARVEFYFSEFLSRLETRRGLEQGDEKQRAKAEIALEMGSLSEEETAIKLFPGNNILFAGTMNEDETTQALSDKVLDRACVLRFGRPKKFSRDNFPAKIDPQEQGVTFDQWKSWLRKESLKAEQEQVNKWINQLNEAMEELDRPFGHRVAQAIQSYVANYPHWVANRLKNAMADQIEQRILPKLRGLEISEAGGAIKKIGAVIAECDDKKLGDAFKQGHSNDQIFIWRGIDRMED